MIKKVQLKSVLFRWIPIVLLLVVAYGVVTNSGIIRGLLAYYDIYAPQTTPQTLAKQIRPYDEWFWPDTASEEEKLPAILFVPGCAGDHPFHRTWAEFFNKAGYAVLLIDSFTPRGFTKPEDFRPVCSGEVLWGFERAGDILVSLDVLREHSRIDPERLTLMGWSHGGWAVMDAVALAANDRRPPLLSALPKSKLSGVKSVVALYPYCGLGTYIRTLGWADGIDGLIISADRDQIVNPQECKESVQLAAQKHPRLKAKHVDAGHRFDDGIEFASTRYEYKEEITQQIRSEVLGLIEASHRTP